MRPSEKFKKCRNLNLKEIKRRRRERKKKGKKEEKDEKRRGKERRKKKKHKDKKTEVWKAKTDDFGVTILGSLLKSDMGRLSKSMEQYTVYNPGHFLMFLLFLVTCLIHILSVIVNYCFTLFHMSRMLLLLAKAALLFTNFSITAFM